ncbi:hypothetical protein HELRODRAFT_65077 [Helobdella robusta]|uniref:DUF1731 domain-containing protein n=1 Tax=Helobdella robusta TaxID=6412 RepID=T1FY29_HELRO|nr:hypothetical protein HELRODRAFT_65077 [Helobdella robusta]ESO02241.1 hypothetical protein HELRODRAFT_65077 [Helobdella robusta]
MLGGGSGFLGRYLTNNLLTKGHDVTWISRSSGINRITWAELSKKGLPERYDAIVNLAGERMLNPFKRWTDDLKKEIESSRISTTRLLSDLISSSSHKPKVWLSSSAIGYYPPSEVKVYNENSKEGDGDFFAELCQKWEDAAKLKDESVRHVTVRIGVILGRTDGTIKLLYIPFFLGLGGKIGSGKQWFSWIHVNDAAGIFAMAIENEKFFGVLNAVAPNCVTNEVFTSAFASALNRPAIFPVPEISLNIMYGKERASIITRGQNVYPERTLNYGYKFEFPDIYTACKECATSSAKEGFSF